MDKNSPHEPDQLHRDALANAAEMKPATVESLAKVLSDMIDVPEEELSGQAPNLLVVSNAERMNGAASLFYPDVMDQIGKEVGGDFFVLPSSIHEVLVLPDNGIMKAEELKDMVASINGDVVDPADVLTDQVYHYDAKERIFEMGEKFEAKKAEKELGSKEIASEERGSVLKELKAKQSEIQPPKVNKDARANTGMEL